MKVDNFTVSAVAFDVVSLFHVYSAVASFLEFSDKPRLVIFLKQNRLGSYCLPEDVFSIRGREIYVRHDHKKKKGIDWVFKFIAFSIIRFFCNRKRRSFILHHTYFKPTGLRFFGWRDLLGLRVVSFEEGIGSYGDVQHHLAVAVRETKKNPRLNFWLKSALIFFVDEKYSVLKKQKTWEGACHKFRIAVSAVNDHFYSSRTKEIGREFFGNKRVCVFFPSPGFVALYKNSEVEYKKELEIMRLKFDEVEIFVKPHPLDENLDIYKSVGFKVLPRDLSLIHI